MSYRAGEALEYEWLNTIKNKHDKHLPVSFSIFRKSKLGQINLWGVPINYFIFTYDSGGNHAFCFINI